MSRQTTLSFAPRARIPEIPSQGAAIILARDENVAVVEPPADVPTLAPKAKGKRRCKSDHLKLEVIKVMLPSLIPSQYFCLQYRKHHSMAETLKKYPEVCDGSQVRKWMKNEVTIRKACAVGEGERKIRRKFQMYGLIFFVQHWTITFISGIALLLKAFTASLLAYVMDMER